MDCLQGLRKAIEVGFYSKDTFDVEEYEYFEQVEVSGKGRKPTNSCMSRRSHFFFGRMGI